MEEEIKKDLPGQAADQKPESELEVLQKKADEYLNNWKRSAADFINYKKEEIGRMAMLGNYAKESMLHDILPILDTIYLAQNHMPQEIKENGWAQGFLQIQKQVDEFLKQQGIEPIEVAGRKFDPNSMEIVSEEEGGESGVVTEELQKGYKMGDKVLRPAKVKVIK